MKLETYAEFLSRGSAQLTGAYRGVGIHPSSEVDLVDVGSYRLGVGSIVPVTAAGAALRAVRRAPDFVVADGDQRTVGQTLVLQLYEDCDPLVPPGPRLPTYRSAIVKAADLGANIAGATLALRLPMYGRRMASIRFKRIASTADLSLVVLAVARGDERNGAPNTHYMYTQKTTETWWNGGGVAPAISVGGLAPQLQAASIYVGGFGDGGEHYDELLLYLFGAADVGNDAHIAATAYGDEEP